MNLKVFVEDHYSLIEFLLHFQYQQASLINFLIATAYDVVDDP